MNPHADEVTPSGLSNRVEKSARSEQLGTFQLENKWVQLKTILQRISESFAPTSWSFVFFFDYSKDQEVLDMHAC